MIWDIFFLIPFFYGLYLFVKTPLTNRFGLPTWSDPSLGFSLIILSALYFYFAHFASSLIPEGDSAPCGKLSRQMECYNLSEQACMLAWTSSSGDCEDHAERIRKSRPSFLMGNFLMTCIGRNFDKTMRYNRKNETTPNCQNYFYKIEKRD